MMQVIQQIEAKYKVYHLAGCTAEEVITAEKALGLTFSDEYRSYLMTYGAISFGCHEFTGLGVDEYIDVVLATKEERKLNQRMPNDCILIENLGIEGILILQDSNGDIYSLDEKGRLEKVANSFRAYMESLI